ncbi:MAG: acetylxylan esterase [Bacteroidaceae bacterium]|nr:acetylxylan esterase [Bacteroidaceae bacterium]
MNKSKKFTLIVASLVMLIGLQGCAPKGGTGKAPVYSDTTIVFAKYFTPATTKAMTPDEEGFIRRWSVLEPIEKANRSNTVFTDSYIRNAFVETEYFPNQFSVIPNDGDVVKVGNQELKWHQIESNMFNVKLFRFATGLDKQKYGVIFWAVTIIECEEEMKDVRLAVGSNSASMWWLNGEEAMILSGDRRMVADDGISQRLTLKKGKNVLRGAVINGPGMSDFCVRFYDSNNEILKDLNIVLN